MTRRITQSDTPEHPKLEIPETLRDNSKMLFHRKPSLRRLIVVMDSNTMLDEDNTPAGNLLASLLTHPYIDLYRYTDNVPPQDAEQVKHRLVRLPTYVGWAIPHDESNGVIPVTMSLDNKSFGECGITGNIHTVAREDGTNDAYSDMEAADAAKRRYDDAIAALAAKALNADIFITNRPYLFKTRLPLSKNILVTNPEDALPVIGLYLRAQMEYVMSISEGSTIRTSRWDFFWVASHELLTQSWRLYAACSQHMQGSVSDKKPAMLESTMHHRLGRALQARDGVHMAINDINSDEILISELDGVLVNLVSILDVTAQIAHRALGLTTLARGAKWQNDNWWRQFDTSHPDLSSLIKTGSYGKKVLKLLGSLRNTIHDETLLAVKIFENPVSRHIGIIVVIPSDSETEVVNAADALGGHELWGIKQQSGHYILEPDTLVDKLVPEVIELLDKLIEKIPLESLDNVNLTPADCQPPTDPQAQFFAEPFRKNVRMQLGL